MIVLFVIIVPLRVKLGIKGVNTIGRGYESSKPGELGSGDNRSLPTQTGKE